MAKTKPQRNEPKDRPQEIYQSAHPHDKTYVGGLVVTEDDNTDASTDVTLTKRRGIWKGLQRDRYRILQRGVSKKLR